MIVGVIGVGWCVTIYIILAVGVAVCAVAFAKIRHRHYQNYIDKKVDKLHK